MRSAAITVFVGLGLVVSACSDDVDDAERARVVEWLIEHDETPETAACLADELSKYEVADFDALAAITDNTGVDQAFSADVEAAFVVCE